MSTETARLGLTKATYGEYPGTWDQYARQDRDRLEDRLSTVYAGDPNGNVAGYWEGQRCTDQTNNRLYICSATGVAAVAVWTEIGSYAGFVGSINALTALTAPAVDDLFAIWDLSASGNRSLSFANFLTLMASLTALSASDIVMATDQLMIYDVSATTAKKIAPNDLAGLSKVVGRTVVQNSAYTTVTTTFPSDNTKPQITEGTELFSGAYTASATTNKLRIEGRINFIPNSNAGTFAAIFDGSADAIWAGGTFGLSGRQSGLSILHEFFPTATTAITYSVRFGADDVDAGVNLFVNGDSGAALFGGVNISELVITELKP